MENILIMIHKANHLFLYNALNIIKDKINILLSIIFSLVFLPLRKNLQENSLIEIIFIIIEFHEIQHSPFSLCKNDKLLFNSIKNKYFIQILKADL
jgi:hypothetical protein